MTRIATAALAAGLMIGTAASALASDITATDAWARARIPDARAGGAYVTLTNTGAAPDALIAAASPVADVVEIHTHRHVDGVMRMEQVEEIPLPAGETVTLQPGGLHIMLIGLREPLAEGKHFPVTLTFRTALAVTVDVTVMGIASQGPKQ